MNPDEPYFKWIVTQISFPETFDETFDEMLRILYETEFIWMVTGDDNRVQDARDLRSDFMNKFDIPNDFPELEFKSYISVLEVIIAVSRLLEFVAGGIADEWAWQLIENLRLNHCYDPLTKGKRKRLNDILDALIWRTYERNGRGGFFPLLSPEEDQTKVEIWYQLNTYVNEIVEA